MAIHGPQFTVTHGTTLKQIDDFLAQNTKAGDKILGKLDKATGNTILYVGGKTSLKDAVTGKAQQRKENAKNAFEQALAQTATGAKDGLSKAKAEQIDKLLSDIAKLRASTGQHGMTTSQFGALASAYLSAAKAISAPKPQATGEGPKLADLGPLGTAVKQAADALVSAFAGHGDMDAIADGLGDTIATGYLAGHATDEDRLAFATDNGKTLRTELRTAMEQALGPDGKARLDDPRTDDMLAAAFNRAASKMLPQNAELATTSSILGQGGKPVDLPHITIGGKEYKPERFLGEGGFAKVYGYQSVENPEERIAFKIMNPPAEGAKLEARDKITAEQGREIVNHMDIEGAGHENIIGFKGMLRTPDGRLGIAMETAPNGTVFDFAAKLDAMIGTGPGKISGEQANVLRLTLIQDMAAGLAHLQDAQGMAHLDFKSPNCLIDEEGRVKVADFGNAEAGAGIVAETAQLPANPAWLAPEVIIAKGKLAAITEDARKVQTNETKYVESNLKALFPTASKSDITALGRDIMKARSAELSAGAKAQREGIDTLDARADTFSLGQAAMDLFRGTYFGKETSFMSEVENDLAAFGKNPFNRAVDKPDMYGNLPSGALMKSTGDDDVDAFLNSLLDPVPSARPQLSTAIGDPIFTRPGVGSDAARGLLLAIIGGDAGAIDTAKGVLDNTVHAPPDRPLPPTPDQVGQMRV
ncbi:protein kinase domain-containing protein [Prosthecomicrobium sp. N25]|uniref:protein kinase domain-containing protein n=1 Tax=Prosthecomicrobium sp. N25 TaxID=3129254 RepID=UPI0030778470